MIAEAAANKTASAATLPQATNEREATMDVTKVRCDECGDLKPVHKATKHDAQDECPKCVGHAFGDLHLDLLL
jgi:hypothetical protein